MKKTVTFIILLFSLTCYSQNGLHFDDVDDMIQTTYPGILGNNAITVEAWIKPNAASGESIVTDWGSDAVNGGRFTLRVKQLTSTDVMRVEIKGGGLDGTVNVADGAWHHVALTYNPALSSNKYKIYVDGVLDVQGDISQSLNIIGDVNLRMGRRISTSFTGWFGGNMDEVRIWSVARSAAQIQSNMNAEFCTAQIGLQAYFQFNQGTAGGNNTGLSTAIDQIAGNNGTLNSFALTGNASNWVTGASIAIAQSYSITNTFNECPGFSTTVGNNTYSTTGVYTDVFAGANGCDSIIITDLTILAPALFNQVITICNGTSYTYNGHTYSNSGQYSDTLYGAASTGCDSIVRTNLTVLGPLSQNLTVIKCAGETFTLNGTIYSVTGNYTEVLVGGSVNGCDSTIYLDLTVLSPISSNITIIECFGGSYSLNGTTYTTTGVYTEVLAASSVNGCDSTVTLDLTISPQVYDSLVYNECFGYEITIAGTTYDTTGFYTIILNNGAISGCDSIIYLDLTIDDQIDVSVTLVDLTITASSTNTNFQWIDCSTGDPISGEVNATFTATANGQYAVILTKGNCVDTSDCVTIDNVGLHSQDLSGYKIFPNPATNQFTITFDQIGDYRIRLVNNFGQFVQQSKTSDFHHTFDLSNLAAGIYWVEITEGNHTTRKKLVKR